MGDSKGTDLILVYLQLLLPNLFILFKGGWPSTGIYIPGLLIYCQLNKIKNTQMKCSEIVPAPVPHPEDWEGSVHSNLNRSGGTQVEVTNILCLFCQELFKWGIIYAFAFQENRFFLFAFFEVPINLLNTLFAHYL